MGPDDAADRRPGYVVVLNGIPRSGKSAIVRALQESPDAIWLNLGVDSFAEHVTPRRLYPGIGLRPGGERPDLEPIVDLLYDALYAAAARWSGLGYNVAVDVGHHDGYAVPRGTLRRAAAWLHGLPAYVVGVRCPTDVIMDRRRADGDVEPGSADRGDAPLAERVARWEHSVHAPGMYDLEVDTSALSAAECATLIQARIAAGPPRAVGILALPERG